MSSEKYIPFGVKASNLASVANFSSTLEDSYILIIAWVSIFIRIFWITHIYNRNIILITILITI